MCLLTHLTALNLCRKEMSVHSHSLRDILLEVSMLIQHGVSHFQFPHCSREKSLVVAGSLSRWRYGSKNLKLPGDHSVCRQEVGLSYHTTNP